MDRNILQTLQGFYQHSRNPVLIMNWDWEIIWVNITVMGISDLPSQLGLSRNHSENGTYPLYLNGKAHNCRLLCNDTDGLRIAELESAQTEDSVLEPEIVTTAVQSVTSVCHALACALEESGLCEEKKWLNAILGACYRLNRPVFVQQELERMNGEGRRNVCFSLQSVLRDLYNRAGNILRHSARIEMQLPAEEVYMYGDMDECTMAVLSAIVLTVRDERHIQEIELELRQQGENAVIQITSSPTPEERTDKQLREGFGSLNPEKKLLNSFCGHYRGHWMIAEDQASNAVTCRLEVSCSERGSKLELHSPRDPIESPFYNKYEILLSRMHYRDFF